MSKSQLCIAVGKMFCSWYKIPAIVARISYMYHDIVHAQDVENSFYCVQTFDLHPRNAHTTSDEVWSASSATSIQQAQQALSDKMDDPNPSIVCNRASVPPVSTTIPTNLLTTKPCLKLRTCGKKGDRSANNKTGEITFGSPIFSQPAYQKLLASNQETATQV